MRNWFKCCAKREVVSQDEDSPSEDSGVSGDDMSMISVTYCLESFNKNAMLLFCQVSSTRGSRNRDLAMTEVGLLKNTFQKYRFEVETHVDLTSSEVEEKCDQFFSRDFSEYGAVAVVIMAAGGKPGELAASDKLFHENLVLKHYTTQIPMTLRGKPKILITEADRQMFQDNHQEKENVVSGVTSCNTISFAIEDCYEDILGFHIPLVVGDASRSPLQIFCERMNVSEDHGNLISIVIGSVEEIEETYPDLKEKLELTCTFRKRFTLPMFVLLA